MIPGFLCTAVSVVYFMDRAVIEVEVSGTINRSRAGSRSERSPYYQLLSAASKH